MKYVREKLELSNNYDENKINFYEGDIRNKTFLKEVFFESQKKNNPIDGVIHFAGLKSVRESTLKPLLYWDVNVNGSINLFKTMEENNCRTILNGSGADEIFCGYSYYTKSALLLSGKMKSFRSYPLKTLKWLLKGDFFKSNSLIENISHLKDIIDARIKELVNLIHKSNINLKYFNTKNNIVCFKFEDESIPQSCKSIFKNNYREKDEVRFISSDKDEHLKGCINSAELTSKGWEKEAIPIIQTKKSIISRIFSSIFN